MLAEGSPAKGLVLNWRRLTLQGKAFNQRQRRANRGEWLLFALLLVSVPEQARTASPQNKPISASEPRESLFTSAAVVRIQIDIPQEGMDTLRQYHWRGRRHGGTATRESVKATVREGGRVYRDVSIHLKGAAGSFRPIDDRPALTLNFDKWVKGQTFHGLEKISLNNSVQDPTYLNEKICREMFAAAGVPVPWADHAMVELNGRKLGLYVLTEGFNKQFLKRHFKNSQGNLYDGGFLTDVTEELALNSGSDPKGHSDLKALVEAAIDPVSSNRWARLEQVLDMDRFISMLSMEILQCHWDGYALNRNNYWVYHDPDSNKMVFMPHGLDQMFGVERSSPSMPILPRMQGLVAQSVLQTPDGRRRYMERTSQLLTNVLRVEAITNRVKQLAARIRPLLAERGAPEARFHDQHVAKFCERIAQRAEYVQNQLAMPSPEVRFDATGTVKLTGWKFKADFGKPGFAQNASIDGRTALRISAEQGSSVGSWRTKVLLESGRYRLEGKVKTQGVLVDPGDRRGGAGFRAGSRRQTIAGTTDWTNLGLDFAVQDGLGEIELSCDLRAAKGQAWFETDSLRLVRK